MKCSSPVFQTFGLTNHRNVFNKRATSDDMKQLPEIFHPGEHDVICARGRRAFFHSGNAHFRTLIENRLAEYNTARSKIEKSYILDEVVTEVRTLSPSGGFVKKCNESRRWYEVGDFLSREKTSQAFRDALHDKYKSSNESKKSRRRDSRKRKEGTSKKTRKVEDGAQNYLLRGYHINEISKLDLPHMPSMIYQAAQLKSCSSSEDSRFDGNVTYSDIMPYSLTQNITPTSFCELPQSISVQPHSSFESLSREQEIAESYTKPEVAQCIFDHHKVVNHLEPDISLSLRLHCLRTNDSNHEASVYERLLELVGDVSETGDPFSPIPLTEH